MYSSLLLTLDEGSSLAVSIPEPILISERAKDTMVGILTKWSFLHMKTISPASSISHPTPTNDDSLYYIYCDICCGLSIRV